MSDADDLPLAVAIGRRCRELREEAGRRQQDVVEAAAALGFTWGRTSVAYLEAGRRPLPVQEFLALPLILSVALKRRVELRDLLWQDDPARALLVAPRLSLNTEIVQYILDGHAYRALVHGDDPPTAETWEQVRRFLLVDAPVTEAERKLSRALGLSAEQVARYSVWLWNERLDQRRDRLVAELGQSPTQREQQARRGHVTRKLKAELEQFVHRFGGDP